jgi:hypothetical protein
MNFTEISAGSGRRERGSKTPELLDDAGELLDQYVDTGQGVVLA